MSNISLNVALIDWLTLSVKGEAMERLRRWCFGRKGEAKPGKKKMNSAWYEGYYGSGFFWGERTAENGIHWGILMVEGEIAHVYAHETWALVLGVDCECTRIDYQITTIEPVEYEPYKFRLLLEKKLGREVGTTGKRSQGVTVEINSRQGERYTRLYEKVIYEGKKETGRLLRLEYEYKGERSREIWRRPLKPSEILLGEVKELITGKDYVSNILNGFKRYLGAKAAKPVIIRKESNTWNWIDSTVRASFHKIINSHEPFERSKLKEFCIEFADIISIMELNNE